MIRVQVRVRVVVSSKMSARSWGHGRCCCRLSDLRVLQAEGRQGRLRLRRRRRIRSLGLFLVGVRSCIGCDRFGLVGTTCLSGRCGRFGLIIQPTSSTCIRQGQTGTARAGSAAEVAVSALEWAGRGAGQTHTG